MKLTTYCPLTIKGKKLEVAATAVVALTRLSVLTNSEIGAPPEYAPAI